MSVEPEAKPAIGVVGGSGLYAMQELEIVARHRVDTPFGNPSDELVEGRLQDVPVVFLARHGKNHCFLPSEVPYRANIWAMKALGVRYLLSVSAVGSLQEDVRPLDMVLPDQFLDRTHRRTDTFFGEGCVAHVAFADPVCTGLSACLARAAEEQIEDDTRVHRGGTYVCMEGPAFSSRAESEWYRTLGATVIGMTNGTEAKLAREAEIAYASLAMVTDFDGWHPDHDNVTVDMVVGNLQANAERAQRVVRNAVRRLHKEPFNSPAHDALRDALLSRPEHVPPGTRAKLDLLTRRYWGDFAAESRNENEKA